MELLIIRHGLPRRDERSEGTADPQLSEVGWEQARATAEFLAREGVDHVVASTMQRAVQTAQPTAEKLGLEIELIDDLKEVDHARGSYIPAEEIVATDAIALEFMSDPYSLFDGDYIGFRHRVVTAFDAVVAGHRGETVAVFCHGMVTSVFLQSILDLDDPFGLSPDYCGLTRVRGNSAGLRSTLSVNETGHLRHLS